jgi:hypothetical protein
MMSEFDKEAVQGLSLDCIVRRKLPGLLPYVRLNWQASILAIDAPEVATG